MSRPEPRQTADEHTTLTQFLDFHRATVLHKLEGLPPTAWKAAARSRAVVAGAAGLDDLSAKKRGDTGEAFSLRWIVVHMIEETARHNGHLDLLREAIDGAVGE